MRYQIQVKQNEDVYADTMETDDRDEAVRMVRSMKRLDPDYTPIRIIDTKTGQKVPAR